MNKTEVTMIVGPMTMSQGGELEEFLHKRKIEFETSTQNVPTRIMNPKKRRSRIKIDDVPPTNGRQRSFVKRKTVVAEDVKPVKKRMKIHMNNGINQSEATELCHDEFGYGKETIRRIFKKQFDHLLE